MIMSHENTCLCSSVVSMHVHVLVHLQPCPAEAVLALQLLSPLLQKSLEEPLKMPCGHNTPTPRHHHMQIHHRKHVEVVRWIAKSQRV